MINNFTGDGKENNYFKKFSISKYNFDEKLEILFIKLTGSYWITNAGQSSKPHLFTPLVPKVIYFCLFGLFGIQRPYVPLFLTSIGMKSNFLGVVLALTPLISFLFSPIWSGLADTLNAHKLIFLLMTFMTGFCLFLLNFISNHYIATLVVLANAVFWAPIIPLADSTCYKILGPHKEFYGKQRMYGSIGFCIAAFATGQLSNKFGVRVAWINYPIASTVLFTFLLFFYNSKSISNLYEKLTNNSNDYQQTKQSQESNDSSSQIEQDDISLIKNDQEAEKFEMLKSGGDGYTDGAEEYSSIRNTDIGIEEEEVDNGEVPEFEEKVKIVEDTPKQHTFAQGVKILLSNPRIIIILFNCIIVSCGMSVCNNFLGMTLIDPRYFNAPTSLVGICSVINVVFEVIFFFMGKELLLKIGIFKLIILSHCALITRVVCYSILLRLHIDSGKFLILPVELLHGIVFASIWNSGSSLINELSPPGLAATGQSLFFGVYMGLGNCVGGLIGGVLYEIGPITMFEFVAAVVSFGLIVFLITEFLMFNKNKSKLNNSNIINNININSDNNINSSNKEVDDLKEEQLNLKFNQLLKDELKEKHTNEEEEAYYNNIVINNINDEIENHHSTF